MKKLHVAFFRKDMTIPTRTRCQREILPGVLVKIVKDDDPEKYKGVDCHWCRWGRTKSGS